jgi:hypothetical protein
LPLTIGVVGWMFALQVTGSLGLGLSSSRPPPTRGDPRMRPDLAHGFTSSASTPEPREKKALRPTTTLLFVAPRASASRCELRARYFMPPCRWRATVQSASSLSVPRRTTILSWEGAGSRRRTHTRRRRWEPRRLSPPRRGHEGDAAIERHLPGVGQSDTHARRHGQGHGMDRPLRSVP